MRTVHIPTVTWIEFIAPTADVPLLQCSLYGAMDMPVTERYEFTNDYGECWGAACNRGTGNC